jgi:MoaA/NifB/PqqE/SkfB family radical SAM enzyme
MPELSLRRIIGGRLTALAPAPAATPPAPAPLPLEPANEPARQQVINVRFYTDYPECNYKCPYCCAGHAPPEGRPESPWDEARYLAVIENLCKVDFPINVRIGVGGEFFVSKVLVEGARRLAACDHVKVLNLITNLSFHPQQYARILKGIPKEKVALVASYHPTEVKSADAWVAAAKELSTYYDLTTMSVAYPPALQHLRETKAKFAAAGLDHFIQPFIGEYQGKLYPQAYSDEERAIIREVIYSRHDWEFLLNLKKPGLCNAGFKYLFIDPYGVVKPCGGADHERVLGDLTRSPKIEFLDGARPCPASACQCDTENIQTKVFEDHYAWTDKNQHRFGYRFADEAKASPWMDEWTVPY